MQAGVDRSFLRNAAKPQDWRKGTAERGIGEKSREKILVQYVGLKLQIKCKKINLASTLKNSRVIQ